MFEKVSRIAEQATTSASRRQFLGRIGTGAMATAAAFAGLLAHVSPARAGKGGNKGVKCCHYFGLTQFLCKTKGSCKKKITWESRTGKEVRYLDYQTDCSSCEECIAGACS